MTSVKQGSTRASLPRRFRLLPLIALLTGCVTSGTGEPFSLEKLRQEGKSVVLLHTSLHEQTGLERCDIITAVVSRPDASGRFPDGERITIKPPFDLRRIPSRMELPAGEYGIVHLDCHRKYFPAAYAGPVAVQGSRIDGSGRIYEKPLVRFKVGAGEVVDIGSATFPVPVPGVVPKIGPIPEQLLQTLAESSPDLVKARTIRPMSPG
jgi:hypothetical protein